MKLPFRRHRKISRGQALVEFAFILPILVLLLLLAVDFGRVFFGWVALNNATADSLTLGQANEEIGNGMRVISDGTSWLPFVSWAAEAVTSVVGDA